MLEQTYNLSDFRFDGDAVYGDHRIAGNPVQAYKAEMRYEHPSGVYFGPNVEWNIVKYPVDEGQHALCRPLRPAGFSCRLPDANGFSGVLRSEEPARQNVRRLRRTDCGRADR